MQNFIKGKNVLGVFSDPAGAKSVLSYLNIFGDSAKSIKTFTNKSKKNYGEFNIKINNIEEFEIENLDEVNILITGTSLPNNIEIEFIELSIEKKIFSISFVDHWTNIQQRFKYKNKFIYPNMICLVDEYAKDIAIKQGIPKDILHAIGNPHHSYLSKWKPSINREDFLNSLNIGVNNNYLLYSPEPFLKFNLDKKYGFNEIDGLKLLHESISKLDTNISLIVKAHPNEENNHLEKLLNSINKKEYFYIKSCDMNHLIFYSAANIGFFSNSLIESSIMGVKTIRMLSLLNDPQQDPLKHLKYKFINIYKPELLYKYISL